MSRAKMADLLFPLSDGPLSTVRVLQILYLIVRVWFSVHQTNSHFLGSRYPKKKITIKLKVEACLDIAFPFMEAGRFLWKRDDQITSNTKISQNTQWVTTEAQQRHQTTCHSRPTVWGADFSVNVGAALEEVPLCHGMKTWTWMLTFMFLQTTDRFKFLLHVCHKTPTVWVTPCSRMWGDGSGVIARRDGCRTRPMFEVAFL